MGNIWWLLIGFVFGGGFILFGILPFIVRQFILDNVGKTFIENSGDETYEIEIRKK